MEASTGEQTVTVLSKLDDRQQPILHTCVLHTEMGAITFKDGRANGVPLSVAKALLKTRADVEVPNLPAAAAPAVPDTDGEIVEEPIRTPPGPPPPVSAEEERERAQASVEYLRSEGMDVPTELLVAAGEQPAGEPPAPPPDPALDGLTDDELGAVLDLLEQGTEKVLDTARAAGVTVENLSLAEVAVRILRQWQANMEAIEASRAAGETSGESGPQEPSAGASQDEQGQDGGSEPSDDPDDTGPQTRPEGHSKAIPPGFTAMTGDGELRCLAAKGDKSQCANPAVGSTSACGLPPHKAKVAELPDAPD